MSLAAASSLLIEYSTNGRGYTILGCIFLLLTCISVRCIRRGGAFCIQRASPYARVFLFLLPLYFAGSAPGLIQLADMAGLQKLGHRHAVVSAFSAAMVIILGTFVIRRQSIAHSLETGCLRDAESIAHYMREEADPSCCILAVVPSDAPLLYYFKRLGIPARRLINRYDGRKEPFLVVEHVPYYTLERSLRIAGTDLSRFEQPVLVHRYGSAVLYLLQSAQQAN